MVDDFQPSRQKADLAEVVEMLLDKGVVLNADIAVSVGDTQLLGIQVRAALASFETAAKYGLEFPEGTDMRRVAEAAGEPELAEEYAERRPPIDPTRGVNVSAEEGDFGREGESESEGEGEGDGEEVLVESVTEGGGETETGDRGSERLGARPDPDQPNSGDVDVFDDGPLDLGEDDDAESDEGEGEGEGKDESEGETGESDSDSDSDSESGDEEREQERDQDDQETTTAETEESN